MSLQTLNLNLALTININQDGTATVAVNTDAPVIATPATPIIEASDTKAVEDKPKRSTKKAEAKKDVPPPPPPPVEPVIVTDEQKEAVTSAMEKVEQDATSTAPLFPQDVQPTAKKDVPPPPPPPAPSAVTPPPPSPLTQPVPVVDVVYDIEDAVIAPVMTPEEIERQRKIEAAKSVFGNDPALNTQRAPITPPPPPPPAPSAVTPPPPPPPPPPVQPAPVAPTVDTPPAPQPTPVAEYMPTPMEPASTVPSPEELTRMDNTDMTMDSMWQTLFGNPPDPNSI